METFIRQNVSVAGRLPRVYPAIYINHCCNLSIKLQSSLWVPRRQGIITVFVWFAFGKHRLSVSFVTDTTKHRRNETASQAETATSGKDGLLSGLFGRRHVDNVVAVAVGIAGQKAVQRSGGFDALFVDFAH